MSGKTKQRSAASTIEGATLSVNERILKECHNLYTEPDCGLINIAESLGVNLLAPRKKITVLLIGNHSAGKSSFVNWYIEEHVQKTGVAIETQGFTFVTSGRKRESLTGNATLHLYPHFEPMRQITGVCDYLTTEISTSKQKKFSLVTFVDTPGLVDGDMKYPYDVNKAIQWLGDLADLIFVFFDPIGQALCKRTLNLVEKLTEKHAERIRFYLSKADEAGLESDRQRVMMQIVQELCKRPSLNRTSFDMPTIYIPNPQKPSRCANQIEDVCKDIEKTINQTIQNTLNSLEQDCENIATKIEGRLEEDRMASSKNFRGRIRGCGLYSLAMLVPFAVLLNFLVTNTSRDLLRSTLGAEWTDLLLMYLAPIGGLLSTIPKEYHLYASIALFSAVVLFIAFANYLTRSVPTLPRRKKRQMLDHRDYVMKCVKVKKQKLYEDYLQQCVAEQDL